VLVEASSSRSVNRDPVWLPGANSFALHRCKLAPASATDLPNGGTSEFSSGVFVSTSHSSLHPLGELAQASFESQLGACRLLPLFLYTSISCYRLPVQNHAGFVRP
jgi:hypothetical protein